MPPPHPTARFDLDDVTSTNDEAKRLIDAGHPPPLAVVARTQSAGRGRRGRTWASPRGGLWMSIAWPASDEPAHDAPLPLAAALAALDAIQLIIPTDAHTRLSIKWPNDLLFDGAKICGIIGERTSAGVVILGIGINANLETAQLPDDLRHPATSLAAALGNPIDLAALSTALIERLNAELSAAATEHALTNTAIERIHAALAHLNEPITIHTESAAPLVGTLRGIDPSGAAILDTDAGSILVHAGEVYSARALSGPNASMSARLGRRSSP